MFLLMDQAAPLSSRTDVRNGTSNRDIYAQRIDSSGAALWTANGVVIVNASNGQYAPVLVTMAPVGRYRLVGY